MERSNNSKSKLPHYVSSKIHPSNDPETDHNSYSLEKFRLYETRQRFYLVGSDRNKQLFRVLKIDRSEPSDLNISEDPVVYSPQEIKNLLQRIAEGNRATGGLNFVVKAYGIAGCIKFLESYYLILVTKRRQIGFICGHAIYGIDESQLITIPHVSVQTDVAHSKTELRYKKLLSSVDLTKDFFFSYTYPIMQSLQKNVTSMGEDGMPYDNMFVWNAYLTRAIRSRCGNTIWTIALVHGNFKQIRLSIFGRDFSVSLVSRRSRHFAGTRDASLRDLRVNSGDPARIGSNNENLNSMINQDRESDSNQLKKQDKVGEEGPHFQSGVLRTNCIDCLDRTNVAQYAYGLAALGRQLLAMGLTDMPKVDPDSTIAAALMDMYQSMGDALAQQYGGSAAHNTVFLERQGKWKATTQSSEFIKSIKRYYSNENTDGEKQDAINLFLGYFQPQEGKPPLWELDSDYHLHVYGNAIQEEDPCPDNCNLETNAKPARVGITLAPIPACREDFLRVKLTSFDKLIDRTCSAIKNVRLCSEPDHRPGGSAGNSGVAPDAAEIQLKSPNWLFVGLPRVDSLYIPK